jgi:hypothetical protein
MAQPSEHVREGNRRLPVCLCPFCAIHRMPACASPEVSAAIGLWSVKALDHGVARLHIAGDVRGHIAASQQANDAAYALIIASILAPLHRESLRGMAGRLLVALEPIGHPSGDELRDVSVAVTAIRRQLAAA